MRINLDYDAFLMAHRLPKSYIELAQRWFIPVLNRFESHKKGAKPHVIGINGCQGSGKSTLADFAADFLSTRLGLSVVILSIDDFYLPHAERQELARTRHPLFATRGVPGTHDLALAHDVFHKLISGKPVSIPRFDKANDDRLPQSQWSIQESPVDVIIFEGWCVGLKAQSPNELLNPINTLEATEDTKMIWRNAVNSALLSYGDWFAYIDELWWLKAPNFACVLNWRTEQEHKLAQFKTGNAIMDPPALLRFVQHYQRLTEHSLQTLHDHSDICWELDQNRQIITLNDKFSPNH